MTHSLIILRKVWLKSKQDLLIVRRVKGVSDNISYCIEDVKCAGIPLLSLSLMCFNVLSVLKTNIFTFFFNVWVHALFKTIRSRSVLVLILVRWSSSPQSWVPFSFYVIYIGLTTCAGISSPVERDLLQVIGADLTVSQSIGYSIVDSYCF